MQLNRNGVLPFDENSRKIDRAGGLPGFISEFREGCRCLSKRYSRTPEDLGPVEIDDCTIVENIINQPIAKFDPVRIEVELLSKEVSSDEVLPIGSGVNST